MKATILFVDDDESMREVTKYHLSNAGYHVLSAKNGMEALSLFTNQKPDLVICDLVMDKMDGVQLLGKIKNISEDTMFIMITAHGSIETAVEAMRIGACDYLEKPFSSDKLRMSVEKSLKIASLEKENKYLRQVAQESFKFKNIIGISKQIEETCKTAALVAPKDTTVLLLGESGTGKELIAKAIHFKSKRNKEPFITINMGAIPENLIDSKLFGHDKGAFTSAISLHKGAFERAHGGTLFLDEIAEMKMDHQIRLLRVLQEKEINRVGSEKPIKVNVRVIAATNQNLELMVKEKKFREDLYYRLYVVPITLPPLRERKDDIPLLLDHFLKKISKKIDQKIIQFDNNAIQLLINYSWPGNIRELENTIERIIVTTSSNLITPEELPEHFHKKKIDVKNLFFKIPDEGIILDQVEKEIVKSALIKNKYNQSAAARFIGITRTSLIRRMTKFGLAKNP